MNIFSNLKATAIGVLIGAMVFAASPLRSDPFADAQLAMINGATAAAQGIQSAMQGILSGISSTLGSITSQLGANGPLALLMANGFNQTANYATAQTAAAQQIANASNIANATSALTARNAQIAGEHVVSPVACTSFNNTQTALAAGGQAWATAASIENVTDSRGEAEPGTPSYYGAAQGAKAITDIHRQRYCGQAEAATGICAASQRPNGDQRALNLFGAGTYDGVGGVTAANDFAINLIQPVAPAPLRGDQIVSSLGVDQSVPRRSYEARMSLSQNAIDYIIAAQSPSVAATLSNQQQMQREGLQPVNQLSWLQAVSLDVDRRYADLNWSSELQAMAPATVLREIAMELGVTNYLLMQQYKNALRNTAINATHLAVNVEKSYVPPAAMSTPSIGGN